MSSAGSPRERSCRFGGHGLDHAELRGNHPRQLPQRSQTAPGLAACSTSLARRAAWCLGPDLGSDHLPMIVEVNAPDHRPRRIRRSRWAFQKADWLAFRAECEAAFEEVRGASADCPGDVGPVQRRAPPGECPPHPAWCLSRRQALGAGSRVDGCHRGASRSPPSAPTR